MFDNSPSPERNRDRVGSEKDIFAELSLSSNSPLLLRTQLDVRIVGPDIKQLDALRDRLEVERPLRWDITTQRLSIDDLHASSIRTLNNHSRHQVFILHAPRMFPPLMRFLAALEANSDSLVFYCPTHKISRPPSGAIPNYFTNEVPVSTVIGLIHNNMCNFSQPYREADSILRPLVNRMPRVKSAKLFSFMKESQGVLERGELVRLFLASLPESHSAIAFHLWSEKMDPIIATRSHCNMRERTADAILARFLSTGPSASRFYSYEQMKSALGYPLSMLGLGQEDKVSAFVQHIGNGADDHGFCIVFLTQMELSQRERHDIALAANYFSKALNRLDRFNGRFRRS